MIGGLGGPELIIILVILVLLFGARKIPELAKGLGTGMREFRKGSAGDYEVEDKKKKEEELASSEDGENAEKDENADNDIKAEDSSIKDESSSTDATIKSDREETRQS